MGRSASGAVAAQPSHPSCPHGRLLKPRLRLQAAMSETHSCADHALSAVESGPSRIMQARFASNSSPVRRSSAHHDTDPAGSTSTSMSTPCRCHSSWSPPRTVGTKAGLATPGTRYPARNAIVWPKASSDTGSAPCVFQPLGSCCSAIARRSADRNGAGRSTLRALIAILRAGREGNSCRARTDVSANAYGNPKVAAAHDGPSTELPASTP